MIHTRKPPLPNTLFSPDWINTGGMLFVSHPYLSLRSGQSDSRLFLFVTSVFTLPGGRPCTLLPWLTGIQTLLLGPWIFPWVSSWYRPSDYASSALTPSSRHLHLSTNTKPHRGYLTFFSSLKSNPLNLEVWPIIVGPLASEPDPGSGPPSRRSLGRVTAGSHSDSSPCLKTLLLMRSHGALSGSEA